MDAVFPTLLHLLISLHHKHYASPLPRVSITPHPTRHLPEDPKDTPKHLCPTVGSGSRLFLRLDPNFTSPKLFTPGAPACTAACSSSILCHGGTERYSVTLGTGTHRPARPAAHPAPCQEVRGHLPPQGCRRAAMYRKTGPVCPAGADLGVRPTARGQGARGSPAWGMVMVSLALLEPTL